MRIEGPDRYTITIHSGGETPFEITDVDGRSKFTGRATTRLPKLYVVTAGGPPVYVGITKQPMRARLRLGWSATGQGGYYGYQWRWNGGEATLDIWYHVDSDPPGSVLDIETVEAELVYLIRCHGQWPEFQTEIHFHASGEEHRAIAARIWSHYEPGD